MNCVPKTDVDVVTLNHDFADFLKFLKVEFRREHIGSDVLKEAFDAYLKPWRRLEVHVSGLPAKLDAFEALLKAIPTHALDEDRSAFGHSMVRAYAADLTFRDPHLSLVTAMLITYCDPWFVAKCAEESAADQTAAAAK